MQASPRKIITRSRNGCAVCKSKRLKCDEAKPHCSRCKRLGIACPGYRKPLKWSSASVALGGDSPSPEITRSPTVWGSMESVSGQSQPIDQSPKDLCDLDFFNSFAEVDTPGSLDIQDIGGLESLISASDVASEKIYPTPTSRVETSQLEVVGNDHDGNIWPGIPPHNPSESSKELEPFLNDLSSPKYPLSHSLQDDSSTLVEYYFKEVCGMMSCYDSSMNPYRTTISKLWTQSPSLYYVTQSMAAACLSEVSPGFSAASSRLGNQAVTSLWNENKAHPTSTASLLALVMLGFSLCWHDPRKLGQDEFKMIADAVISLENNDDDLALADRQKKFFFYNSLVYWKMLLSFVTDQELPSLGSTRTILPQPCRLPEQDNLRMPHPQTGLGVEIQELVAQVGALVRKERKRIRRRRHSSRRDIEESLNAIQASEDLHSKLCRIELPSNSAVIDSGDDMTPADHLLKAAEAYRCTGLLQLYRNFPDLFLRDIESANRIEQSSWLSTTYGGVAAHGSSRVLLDTWLTSLALHVLDLVHEIPMSSRSRSIQPLLLVSICSELSLNRGFVPIGELQGSPRFSTISSSRMEVPPTTADILHGRRLILSRLSFFEGVLAAKPIRQMLTLIKETWALMDKEQEDVYWMDVMIENGYETLMG
ncbi:C6 zinc finger domain protein [Colletotrichum kahawae]|uniref:C6 zinc finger domain protein n=1 Tax=Colletotrichum kahawae TaxID=34407 RepID=A0AAD9Y6D3_COLKA|nr:C6 zinc finger domain protein [Colletotrichum kahawae]